MKTFETIKLNPINWDQHFIHIGLKIRAAELFDTQFVPTLFSRTLIAQLFEIRKEL